MIFSICTWEKQGLNKLKIKDVRSNVCPYIMVCLAGIMKTLLIGIYDCYGFSLGQHWNRVVKIWKGMTKRYKV